LSAFLTAMIISGLILVSTRRFGTVHAATDVIGIISSDTTWAKANSPYTFTGPVAVDSGVTLTIEPGVTANLGKFYLQVNGTLRAQGTSVSNIIFNSDISTSDWRIIFNDESNDWNGQTHSGSIIENAVLTSILIGINYTSPKISNNSISGGISGIRTSSTISNNIIGGIYPSAISTVYSSAVISGNTINGRYGINCLSDSSIISNNTITGPETGIISSGSVVSRNTVYGCGVGIDTGSSTIEQNLVINSGQGIVNHGYSLIQNNTIANSTVGIYSYKPSTIIYNNIQNNSEYNIRLDRYATSDLNATYNWWGTTDSSSINQTIYDNKYDFNLGTVTFIPFLTAPNPEAPPMPAPTPTPSATSTSTPTQSPSSSPSPPQNPTASSAIPQIGLNEIEVAILTVLIVIAALLIVAIALMLKKRR
jgi:hypothetical protein